MAALLVVIGHLRSLIFPEYAQLNNPSLWEKVFYFITGLGHQGVIIFFVLSGFLVGGEFIKMNKSKREYFIYFIKRFSRIFTVFIPALIIGGVLDYLGMTYFNQSGIYNNAYHFSAMDYSVIDRFNVQTFISNFFMMQTSLTPTFGSNGPLWSLANEWWYYLLFPVLYLIFNSHNTMLRLIALLFIITMLSILNYELLLYFSVWLLGVLTFYYRKKINFPFIIYISYFLLLIAFAISRVNLFENNYIHDLLIAFTLIILINNLSFINSSKQYLRKFNQYFADFSYSLYLFHFPIVIFILGFTGTNNYNTSVKYIFLLLGIYIYSIILFYIFEKNTYKIKSYILSKVGK